jgi:ribosome maturation factor RimP
MYRVFFIFYIYIGMTTAEKNSIIEMLTPMLDIEGIELVDIEAHAQTLRLLIHKPDGLSLADCQMVNQTVHPILEVHEHLASYTQLEVASPGLDRPLRTAKDFQRNCGRIVQVELVSEDGQKREVQGTVVEVHPGEVVLKRTGGKSISVKISQILNAQIHLMW